MTNKEIYKDICEQRLDDVPLFQQYWWMEAVCAGKQWDVALATEGDKVTGAMPYHYVRRLGLTVVLQPQLTQFSGPVYFKDALVRRKKENRQLYNNIDTMSESHSLDFEKRVASELIAQMETIKPSAVLIHTSPRITNWLPFYWKGYAQTTRYTYRIPDICDAGAVFAAFDKEKRQRKIIKTERQTTVRFDMSPSDFAAFHRRYWESKGEKDLLSEDFIERVCTAAMQRSQGVIASLHGNDGTLLSARFVAYDKNVAYSLLSANDMKCHRGGHSETLMWALIKHLSGKCRAFDFEGSMDEGIEYFYRSFGAIQTPFFEIRKYRNTLVELLFKSINK